MEFSKVKWQPLVAFSLNSAIRLGHMERVNPLPATGFFTGGCCGLQGSYERPCSTILPWHRSPRPTPGTRLVGPKIWKWQHFLFSGLDLIPRQGNRLLFYTTGNLFYYLSHVGLQASWYLLGHQGLLGVLSHSVIQISTKDTSLRECVEKSWWPRWHDDVADTMYNRSMTICYF
jgi:hypothetical protein